MDVRRLGPDDAAAARRFLGMFFDGARGGDHVRAWLADDRNVMVGAWVAGAPAGMAFGYLLPRPDSKPPMHLLYSIDVGEAFRNRGVATRLIEAMKEQNAGMWLLTNASNAAAMALYAKTGGTRPFADDVMFRFEPPISEADGSQDREA